MSNELAVATVTAALRRSLQQTLNTDLSSVSAKVTHVRPNAANGGLPDPGVNIFLYQVTPNAAQRNDDLPSRSSDARLIGRARAALNLHYLLSFYGDDTLLIPQRMLGSVVRALHSQPIITRAMIADLLTDPDYAFLADSDLGNAPETVKLAPEGLSLEELSKAWSVLFETPYVLSVSYIGSVVLLETREKPLDPLPVRTPVIDIHPTVSGLVPTPAAPDAFEALQVWLKSDAGVTYDAGGVWEWLDQSGNGRDAVQPDPAFRPAFVGHGFDGRGGPVLRFDGADDRLAIRGLSYATTGGVDAITVVALVRSDSDAAQVIASFDPDEHWELALASGADSLVTWQTADSGGATDDLRSAEGQVDGRWRLIVATFEAGASPDKRLFVNGAEVARADAHGGNSLGSSVVRFGFVGARSRAGGFDGAVEVGTFLAGDLAEFCVFHRSLTDEERSRLEAYFLQRYRT